METFLSSYILELLLNSIYFFRVYINQYWYFSGSYYQTIHTFQRSQLYTKINITQIKIITQIKLNNFSEFILNNINILGELLSNNIDFCQTIDSHSGGGARRGRCSIKADAHHSPPSPFLKMKSPLPKWKVKAHFQEMILTKKNPKSETVINTCASIIKQHWKKMKNLIFSFEALKFSYEKRNSLLENITLLD